VVIAFKMGMIFQQVPAASNTQLNMTVLGTANTPSTTTTSTAQSLQVDPKSHPKPAA